MSLQPRPAPEVPEETRRVAQAVFPHGNVYLRMRDELGELYADHLFADLFPARGQPAKAPGQLALTRTCGVGRCHYDAVRRRALGSTSRRRCSSPY